MEVKRKEAAFDCYRMVFEQNLRREESVDSVVPDTLPDIGTILSTCGTPLIRSKDIGDGHVRIDANIPVKVAYLPEEGDGVYALDVNIPLSVSPENEEISEDCLCTADIHLMSLEAKALNPRKITVRAELCFSVRCARADSLSFLGAPEEQGSGIQVLEQELELSPVCAMAEKTFVLTDEFVLPAGKPDIAQILSQKTTIVPDEMKAVGSKIVLKGAAKSSIVYLAADGMTAAAEFSTGFSQIVEAEKLPEDSYLSALMLLSGVYYDTAADAEGRTIGMELHLVAQVTVYGRAKAAYLADAYSNIYPLAVRYEACETNLIRREASLRATLREILETPVPAAEILSASASGGCAAVSGGEITLPVNVQIFYKCSAGQLHCARRSFSVKLQTELAESERLYLTNAALQELYTVPVGGGIELRLPVEASAFVFEDQVLRVVGELAYDTNEQLDLSGAPTLVLMHAEADSDLWVIAKENHSTVQAIMEANTLETPVPPTNCLLLIPKTLF